MEELELEDFLKLRGTIIDVRSPSEHAQGHIPGSANFPLFSDSERAVIGTLYKQKSKEEAISHGIQCALPKIGDFLTNIRSYTYEGPLKIHCWRGGMRSAAMGLLFQTEKLPAVILKGGYKSFRQWTHQIFSTPLQFQVLGGLTGTGKTAILKALKNLGEQVIDLEELACHRGSAFGICSVKQPSTEHFQNILAHELSTFKSDRPVWIEDESRMIGSCHLPEGLFHQMMQSPLIAVERPDSARIKILEQDYGKIPIEQLILAVEKIKKKLGSENTKKAIDSLLQGDLKEAGKIIVNYYDSTYLHGLSKRNSPTHTFEAVDLESEACAIKLAALDFPSFSRSLDKLS